MTCIVGITQDGIVTLGADSCGSAGTSKSVRADKKIFANGEFLIGFTSSFRMGQLLQCVFSPPKHHVDVDEFKYMVADFIPAVRACFSAGGYSRQNNGEDTGGTFLVGYRGRLFTIESDFQVGENLCGFDAVGCGSDLALGSLFTSARMVASKSGASLHRAHLALNAAAAFSGGVCGPFHLLQVDDRGDQHAVTLGDIV